MIRTASSPAATLQRSIATIAKLKTPRLLPVAAFGMTSTSKLTPPPDFHSFEAAALARGFQEVLSRKWGPNERPSTHSHPFDAEALVVEGEMWLRVDGHTQHLLPGAMFNLTAGTEHDEWYGPNGAVYWVARRDRS